MEMRNPMDIDQAHLFDAARRRPWRRVMLHLVCFLRDRNWPWHWAGIRREWERITLHARAQPLESATVKEIDATDRQIIGRLVGRERKGGFPQ
jgi:hypothetical protein